MKLSDFKLGKRSFCILDTETTGFSADSHEITEIAALRVGEGFEIIAETSCLVRITNRVSSHITAITGITDGMLRKHGRPLPEALADLHRFVDGHTVYAHNARFDRGFLNASAQRAGLEIRFPVECSIPLFKRLLPGQDRYGLQALAGTFQLDDEGSHRALADCRLLLECMKRAHQRMVV